MSNKITLKDYLTACGRYPERESLADQKVKDNALELLRRVNEALEFLGVESADVSSGFRPSTANSAAGGAKSSAHITGEALDLIDDKDQTLCKLFTKAILEQFDLYREDSVYTVGKNTNWCHLQTRKTASGKRVFKP